MKIKKIGLIAVGLLIVGTTNAQTKGDKKEKQKKEKISPEELFATGDLNNDGVITLDEFMSKNGNKEKSKAKFNKIDFDKDEKIMKEEFLAYQSNKKAHKMSDEEQFASLDVNADGKLTMKEVIKTDEDRSKGQAKFQSMDSDKDLEVSKDEFLTFRKLKAEQKNAPKPSPIERFKMLDANQDGALTLEEFITKESDKDKAFGKMKAIDLNRDNKVTQEEFLNHATKSQALKDKRMQNPENHFAELDSNADGVITLDETMKKDENKEKALKKFGKKDTNGDERITEDEFLEWTKKKQEKEDKKRIKQKEQRGKTQEESPKSKFLLRE